MSGAQRLQELVNDSELDRNKLWLPGEGVSDLELFSQLSAPNFDAVKTLTEGSELGG